jgi:hypothetical protein
MDQKIISLAYTCCENSNFAKTLKYTIHTTETCELLFNPLVWEGRVPWDFSQVMLAYPSQLLASCFLCPLIMRTSVLFLRHPDPFSLLICRRNLWSDPYCILSLCHFILWYRLSLEPSNLGSFLDSRVLEFSKPQGIWFSYSWDCQYLVFSNSCTLFHSSSSPPDQSPNF